MKHLFETSRINTLHLANRFVRSATWEGLATDEGAVTPALTAMMQELAQGEVGLIISSHAYVQPRGQAGPWQLGAYSDDLLDGLKAMTAAVHEAGGTIVLQLAHAGCYSPPDLTGMQPLAVSCSEGLVDGPCREASEEDIQECVSDFARAALRAREAGFDGVQVHSAHGYLLNQFLSPAYNRRTDSYGGPIANRVRVHRDICKSIRKQMGPEYPLLMKINCRDFVENGLSLEDAVQAGKILADAGLDALEISGGTRDSQDKIPSRKGIDSRDKEAYFQEEARAFREAVDLPLMLVGGIRSFDVAERLVAEGPADYISLCRPLIREPGLIKRWKNGDRSPSACASDNLCFVPTRKGKGLACLTLERERQKD